MTVIKLTKSRKAVQVITDEGKVYQTSVNSLAFLLGGKARGDFITTVRMPFNVSPDRYKPSEVWTDGGRIDPRTLDNQEIVAASQDPLALKTRESKKAQKAYTDVIIDNL
jgi:hypothetical protein